MSEIVLFQDDTGKTNIDVRLDGDTVWLTQKQLSDLFGKNVPTINEHLQNIYTDGELEKEATVRDFRIVQNEGRRSVSRDVSHYNLDAIISVGYRVNSKQGIAFRKWATNVLSDHLVRGFTLTIEDEGLKPTSMSRRRSYQSSSGFVYLANTPERAYEFGKFGNMGACDVYEVAVLVRKLLPDKDQLTNKRSVGEDIGNSIGESIVYGGGVRVSGHIDAWQVRKMSGDELKQLTTVAVSHEEKEQERPPVEMRP